MVDTLTPEKRSWNMSRIGARDTRPERIVRTLLHRNGYRFRLHQRGLPGTPDIVLRRHHAVIFVHGCFWHRHQNCRLAYVPKSRQAFWQQKFDQNVERDARNELSLRQSGWRVFRVWECETVDPEGLQVKLRRMLSGGLSE